MIPLSYTLAWLLELARSLLWFMLVVVLVSGLLPWVLPGYHPLRVTVATLASPLLRPARRLLRPLQRGVPVDLAPWLTALVLWLLDSFVLGVLAWWISMLNPTGFGPDPEWALLLRTPIYLYIFLVLLRVLLSWFRTPGHHPFAYWVRRLTDPPLNATRRLLPLVYGALDLSPLLLLAALSFLDRVVVSTLVQYVVQS